MPEHQTILFSPLNWGLGHATRCVPLINKALAEGHKVVIATNGAALNYLQNEIQNAVFETLKGYNMRYARWPFLPIAITLQAPLLFLSSVFERIQTRRIVKRYNITHIVSDNRYGVYCKKCHNSILTHQLYLPLPKWLKATQPIVNAFIQLILNKFDCILVPDFAENEQSLSGKLSHGGKLDCKVKYIGPLSRFSNVTASKSSIFNPDILVVLSGQNPQNRKLISTICTQYKNPEKQLLIVCGTAKAYTTIHSRNIQIINNLPTNELAFLLKNTQTLIVRSGYSTVMDLHALQRTQGIIWVPLKGQWEQEYLAERLKQNTQANLQL